MNLFELQTQSGQLWTEIKAQLDAKDTAHTAALDAKDAIIATLQPGYVPPAPPTIESRVREIFEKEFTKEELSKNQEVFEKVVAEVALSASAEVVSIVTDGNVGLAEPNPKAVRDIE